jgi:ATP-dependent protease ClpP protease subunit
LKSYKGNVNIKIVGIAASSASIIAMAGNKISMSPTAQILIHNASGSFSGDCRDMEKGAEILKNVNASISNAYKIKTGLSSDELLSMMSKETWLTAQQALDNKFIDEIMFTDNIDLVASINNGMLPREIIDKMRNKLTCGELPLNISTPSNNSDKEKLLIEIDLA